MQFKVYREIGSWHLRKIKVELWDGEKLVDMTRMCAYLLWISFPLRLFWRKEKMLYVNKVMKLASGDVKE